MSWFDDLHDSSIQITQNTYEVAWLKIKTELQRLKWKQYNMFLKTLTTHLTLILFVFKYNEKNTINIAKMPYDALSSINKIAQVNPLTHNSLFKLLFPNNLGKSVILKGLSEH